MKRSQLFTICWAVLAFCYFVGCNLLDSDQKNEPLLFEKMDVEYLKFGGWIGTYELFIHSSGEATAKVRAHANRSEVLKDTITTLTAAQRELLSSSFASFSRYERHYRSEKYMTDGNFHQIILTYDGVKDTVSTYMPYQAKLPKNLLKLIEDLEQLHQSILESGN